MEEDPIPRLQEEIDRLSRQLTEYQQQLMNIRRQMNALSGEKAARNMPQAGAVAPRAVAPGAAAPGAAAPGAAAQHSASRPLPPRPTAKAPTEAYIGGNLLSKIGIAALVVGMAIFVKYAFDNDLIGPWGRLLLGWGTGLGLAALALFLKPAYRTYSAVLLSGGVATVYFTTYASFYFYHFLPAWLTFALMVATTLATVWQATRYNVEWIGLFGLVGAYAVPFLVGGNGAPWGLFTYMTILNAGVLALAYRKDWQKMKLFAFLVTWIIFGVFVQDSSRPGYVWISLFFGSVFFLMLYAAMIVHKTASTSVQIALVVFNALIFTTAERVVLPDDTHWMFLLSGAALVHAGVAGWMRSRNRSLALTAWSLTICCLVSVAYMAVSGPGLLVIGMSGAAVFYLLGQRHQSSFLVRWGIVLSVFSVLVLFGALAAQGVEPNVPAFLNAVFFGRLTTLAVLGGMVYAGMYLFRDRPTASWLGALLFLAAYPTGWMECYLHGQSGPVTFAMFTGFYLGSAFLLMARDAGTAWRFIGVFLTFGYALYLLADHPPGILREWRLAHPDTSGWLRYALYAAISLATVGCYLLMRRSSLEPVRQAAVYLLLAGIWYLTSQELVSVFVGTEKATAQSGYDQAHHAGWSVLWGVYSFVLIGIGFGWKWKSFRLAGIALFGIVTGKLLLYDLTGLSTGGKIVVFLSVGVLLLLASFLYQKFRLSDEQRKE